MLPAIHPDRIRPLNEKDCLPGQYVLYWMQQSQRAEWNHALEYAVMEGNRMAQGVVVLFVLMDPYPEGNARHYTFMLEGLRETEATLAKRGIRLVIRKGDPVNEVLKVGCAASLLVCDAGYLRHQRRWRRQVASEAPCRAVQVESDVIVPVEIASPKAEIGARTLRPKLHRLIGEYLRPLPAIPVQVSSLGIPTEGMRLSTPAKMLQSLHIDHAVSTGCYRGGTAEAKRRYADFLGHQLARYDQNHNQPQTDDISHMSMYLHFGQISPVYLALEAVSASPGPARETFLEELIIRRELAVNFVHYTPDYDTYGCIPNWAKQSLAEHARDLRPALYTETQLESAETHDPFWNAAMLEMRETGFMHNYMRMYWGKKILEWSETPEEGFYTTLRLNNRYFLDGRDPNSYAGVAWIYGVHDRAWPSRPVFGKVRCMTASGLLRKCDMPAYIRKVEGLRPPRIDTPRVFQ